VGDAAIWIAALIGGFGTFMWRALGVAVETRVQEDSPLFNWIGCVAYAMVAGLMARVLLMPGGDLSLQPLTWRAMAFLIALAVWYRSGKSVPIGLVAGVISYALILYFQGL